MNLRIPFLSVLLLVLFSHTSLIAQLPSNWKVLCKTSTGEVALSDAHPAHLTEYHIMAEWFLTYNDAMAWLQNNCPRMRCTIYGGCAPEPAYGGDWKVMCHRQSNAISVTRAHPAHYPEYRIIQERLLSQSDAELWINLNYPSWRCDQPATTGNTGLWGGTSGGGGGGGNNSGRSQKECEEEICPACASAITLLGQSTTPECQSCLERNASRIQQCVQGSGSGSNSGGTSGGNYGGGNYGGGSGSSGYGTGVVRDGNFANFASGTAWGTGAYSQNGIWWNSNNANTNAGTFNLNSDDWLYQNYGITTALHIIHRSYSQAHVYGTTAQKVPVTPYATYKISVWIAGNNVNSDAALQISTNADWSQRPLHAYKGSYGWQNIYNTFQVGNVNSIDLRIISQDVGEFWLAGLKLERQ